MRLGILGAGFTGLEIGRRAAEEGVSVWGTTRSTAKAASLRDAGLSPVILDGLTLGDGLLKALARTSHLIISIAPDRHEDVANPHAPVDPVLIALKERSLTQVAPGLRWIGYLSTVGVYGNHDGAWVDEDTPAAPASERSRQRVRAENEWIETGDALGLPVAVFRLSGIYGPGRNALLTANEGRSRRMVKPGQVFNRIHVADIATATLQAAAQCTGGILNITDDEPAAPQEVVAFAHELIGTAPPPEIDFETADISPMARSFYGENKRVSNARSRAALGMEYAFPNYRTALSAMWADGSWRGDGGA
ncbi:SDR family oxidoreductase [Rhizobiaceae bacterium]|nr:SDR family oxidoreductase [Rhizobiaceae bacterium]